MHGDADVMNHDVISMSSSSFFNSSLGVACHTHDDLPARVGAAATTTALIPAAAAAIGGA
eukprot:12403219-Karenia_brevis.AAC.1